MAPSPDALLELLGTMLDEPVGTLTLLGEGTDHRAYATDHGLIVRVVRHSDPTARAAVLGEAELLRTLELVLDVPVPEPVAVDSDIGVLVCRRLPGVSVLDSPPADPLRLAVSLGHMLSQLHGTEPPRGVRPDPYPLTAWQLDAGRSYNACATQLSPALRRDVEAFLAAPPPPDSDAAVLCHNDLGAEHLLVDDAGELTGVIDWADAALTDPCRDLGRLFRDLGRAALETILSGYARPLGADAWPRIVFHARCALLEDLVHGQESGDDRYRRAALTSFDHVFRPHDPPSMTS